jgi:hypothetical protein
MAPDNVGEECQIGARRPTFLINSYSDPGFVFLQVPLIPLTERTEHPGNRNDHQEILVYSLGDDSTRFPEGHYTVLLFATTSTSMNKVSNLSSGRAGEPVL